MQTSIEALDNLVLLINNCLQEKNKRILLGAAAKAYGHGGEQRVKNLTGVAFSTLHRGKCDAEEVLEKEVNIDTAGIPQSASTVDTNPAPCEKEQPVRHTGSKLKDPAKTMDGRDRQRKVGAGRPSVLDMYPDLR